MSRINCTLSHGDSFGVTFAVIDWIDLFIKQEYKADIVRYSIKAAGYLYSSARDYYGLPGMIDIKMVESIVV